MSYSAYHGKSVFDYASTEELKFMLPESITKELYLQETSLAQVAYDLAEYFKIKGEIWKYLLAIEYAKNTHSKNLITIINVQK